MIGRDRTVDIVVRERFIGQRTLAAPPFAAPLHTSVCPCGAPSRVLTEGIFTSRTPRIAPHNDADGNLCGYRYGFVPVGLRGAP